MNLLNIGDQAPDFRISNHEGIETSLDNFKGKKIVIWFFPKANTPG